MLLLLNKGLRALGRRLLLLITPILRVHRGLLLDMLLLNHELLQLLESLGSLIPVVVHLVAMHGLLKLLLIQRLLLSLVGCGLELLEDIVQELRLLIL